MGMGTGTGTALPASYPPHAHPYSRPDDKKSSRTVTGFGLQRHITLEHSFRKATLALNITHFCIVWGLSPSLIMTLFTDVVGVALAWPRLINA